MEPTNEEVKEDVLAEEVAADEQEPATVLPVEPQGEEVAA